MCVAAIMSRCNDELAVCMLFTAPSRSVVAPWLFCGPLFHEVSRLVRFREAGKRGAAVKARGESRLFLVSHSVEAAGEVRASVWLLKQGCRAAVLHWEHYCGPGLETLEINHPLTADLLHLAPPFCRFRQ